MIGKQIKGTYFRGVLKYLHEKENSFLIGGNMVGKTPKVLAAEFQVAQQLNPRLNKAVYHASLSLPPHETLDDVQWQELGREYLEGMGFAGSQYVIYRHRDTDHDHIHIVASRIRITDGTTVSDSWDYVRSEKLIRSLEKKYELTPTMASTLKQQRGQTRGERKLIERTGETSIREKLQSVLEEETSDTRNMTELLKSLKHRGIDARVSYTRTGKVKGISYGFEGIAISGTHLGKAYTFPGLQKYKAVTYHQEMDGALKAISATEPVTPNRDKLTLLNEIKPETADEFHSSLIGSGESVVGEENHSCDDSPLPTPYNPSLADKRTNAPQTTELEAPKKEKPTQASQSQQKEREIELQKKFYRSQYELMKIRVQQKVNKGTSNEEIDVEIGRRMIQSLTEEPEILKILTQSDQIYQLKEELPPEQYRKEACSYVEKIYLKAWSKIQELKKEKERELSLEMEL